jgi:hypothetical protein
MAGAILRAMTALELRRAVVGYPPATVRAAVEAGLRECPFEHSRELTAGP